MTDDEYSLHHLYICHDRRLMSSAVLFVELIGKPQTPENAEVFIAVLLGERERGFFLGPISTSHIICETKTGFLIVLCLFINVSVV